MANGLDMRVARWCAGLSARAYERATIETMRCHVLVEEFEGLLGLAFRGSAATRDWATNARARRAMIAGGVSVRQGFWESVDGIIAQARRLDQRQQPPPVLVTGHSKGAAEALIYAWRLAREGRPVAGVYTFGGPRVGDAGWRRSYDELLGGVTWRFVHQADGVARIPGWLLGWRHAGTEVLLPATGGVVARPRWWFKAAQSLAGIWREWTQGRLAVAADHPVERYVERLGKS